MKPNWLNVMNNPHSYFNILIFIKIFLSSQVLAARYKLLTSGETELGLTTVNAHRYT
jgi:hypothetical protein